MKNINSVYFLAILFLLPACRSRNIKYFPPMDPHFSVISEKEDIEITVTVLDPNDCYDYFGTYAQGYSPLQVQFYNKGNDTHIVRPSYVALKRDSGFTVAQSIHYDTYTRCTFFTLASLFFFWEAIPFIVIPYGFYWRNQNKKITRHICSKSLQRDETLVVYPYESLCKFIFIPEESFVREFDIKIFNETKGALITHHIDLADLGMQTKS